VTRDEDIDVVRHAPEQPQRGEVVLNLNPPIWFS
jgi:hypothetical protein